MEVEGKSLPASTISIYYADQCKKAVFTFFTQKEGKCLMKSCAHAFSHF